MALMLVDDMTGTTVRVVKARSCLPPNLLSHQDGPRGPYHTTGSSARRRTPTVFCTLYMRGGACTLYRQLFERQESGEHTADARITTGDVLRTGDVRMIPCPMNQAYFEVHQQWLRRCRVEDRCLYYFCGVETSFHSIESKNQRAWCAGKFFEFATAGGGGRGDTLFPLCSLDWVLPGIK